MAEVTTAAPASPTPERQAPFWQRVPLWLRLVTIVLLLAMFALVVNAAVGTRLLRGYLTEQTDEELRQTAAFFAEGDPEQQIEALHNLPINYYVWVLDSSGDALGGVKSIAPSQPETPQISYAEARERNGRGFILKGQNGKSEWRAVAFTSQLSVPPYIQRTVVVATSLDDVEAAVHRLGSINIFVGLFLLGGLALVAYGIVRTTLKPLTQMEETADAITAGDLSRRVPEDDPSTEIGKLGQAFNTMLNRIETAFRERAASEQEAIRSEARMRRFVADASHELRTPLTSIRGFAELHRQGAVTDPEGTANLLRQVEDQATRMGTLVNDLLLLARLDQQRPLAHEPVDLVALARDAADSARARDPNRTVELVRSLDELYVVGDEVRLRQVLDNLVDNALVHTPAGTPVEVTVGRRDGGGRQPEWAVVEVRDEGLGLTPEQAEHVFDRFYRTDSARSRPVGGAGLGLSIVQAIAEAHGGRAEVDTSPGQGATFGVLLPLPDDPPPDPALPPYTASAVADTVTQGGVGEAEEPDADKPAQPEPPA